ncbi:MAG: LUD domain-containing protein [Caldilineales bacterium]
MTDARDAILGRLRQIGSQPPLPGLLPGLARLADGDAPLIDRFTAALERVGGTWELADSPVSARLHLVTALQAGNVTRVLTWQAQHLPSPGTLDTLNLLGIETLIPDLRAAAPRLRPQDVDSRGDLLQAAGAVEVGVVAASAGFADTGTLAVCGGAGRPLLSAFLPRRVIVLLPVGRLYPSAARWLARSGQPCDDAVVTFLSGPSQSLDLELIRAAGIHGPRYVHVVLVGEPL